MGLTNQFPEQVMLGSKAARHPDAGRMAAVKAASAKANQGKSNPLPVRSVVTDQMSSKSSHQFSIAIRDAVRDALTGETRPTDDHVSRTKALASNQRTKPLPAASKFADARQQVHTTGTSSVKVIKNKRARWANAKKKSGTQDHRAKMMQRRDDQIRAAMGPEGWLDFSIKHVFSMDKNAFVTTTGAIIDAIRERINSNKSILEIVIGADTDQLFRYFISLACCIASAVFAYQFSSTRSWVALICAGISALMAIYASHKEIFEAAQDYIREYILNHYAVNVTVGQEVTPEQAQVFINDFLDSTQRSEAEAKKKGQDDSDKKDDGAGPSGAGVAPESGDWMFRTGLSMVGDLLQGFMVGGIGLAVCNQKGKLIENLSKVPRIAEGVSALIEMLLKWGSTIVDTIFNLNTQEYFSQNKALDKWAREVMETAARHDEGKLEINAASAMVVTKLAQRGRELVAGKLVTTHYGIQVHRMCVREIERLQLNHSKSGLGAETKPEPFAVLLMGESGVGKSFTTQRLMKFVGVRLMGPGRRERFLDDFNSEVWPYCIEEDHDNGYNGQFFTVMDDLGQQKPAPGAKTEGMAVVRFVNPTPGKMNMADLHNKGKVSFISEFLFGSTNLYKFWDLNMQQPEAFLRRWHTVAIVAPKKAYCTPATANGTLKERRLDRTKLSGELDLDVAEFHIVRYEDIAQQTINVVEVLNFQEFEDRIVEEYQAHSDRTARLHKAVHAEATRRLDEIRQSEGEVKYEGWFSLSGEEKAEWDRKARLNQLPWTKHMSWTTWATQTTLYDKCHSAKHAVGRMWRSAERNVLNPLDRFASSVVDQYKDLINQPVKTKAALLQCALIICVIWSQYIWPFLKPHIPEWNFKMPWSKEAKADIHFDSIEGYLQFIMEDQRAMLRKQGIDAPGQTAESFEKAKQVTLKICRRTPNELFTYTRTHLDGKVGTYRLETQYQGGLFAQPNAQSQFEANYVGSLYRRSVYHMYAESADIVRDSSAGKVTFVKGKIMLLNKHYIYQIRKEAGDAGQLRGDLRFVPHGRSDKVIRIPLNHFLDEKNISGMESEEDYVLVNCDPYVSDHTDIVGKFVSEEQGASLQDHEFTAYLPVRPDYMKQHDVMGSFVPTANVGSNTHRGMFWYWAPTSSGDCGGLLIDTASGDPKSRIVGIHAAGERLASGGQSKLAFAQRVSREGLERLLSKWDIPTEARQIGEFVDYESTTFMELDVVKKDTKTNIIMTKSSLAPSYMHGWAGAPTRVPAPLAPFTNTAGEYMVPLHNALEGEKGNNVPVDVADVEACVHFTAKALMRGVRKRNKVLTSPEAILGVPGSALKPIQRDTSAGYYGLHNPGIKPGKRGALGRDGEYTLNTAEALRLIRQSEEQWELMKQGKPSESPYLLFLKDEKRSRAKAEAGKARLVKAASVDEVINIRRVYGAVVSDLMEHHTLSGIAVGINPLGTQWDFLATHLRSKGKKVVAGDFAGFDQSQSGQLLRATLKVMQTLAGHQNPEVQRIEKCIEETLAAPRCMVGDLIYQNDHGLPSGNPLTSIMNSVFVQLAFRLVWLKIMRKEGESRERCLEQFDVHVLLVSYGDDHLANISDEVAEQFNQHSLIESFPLLGLTYTSDDKEDKNPPKYRDLAEVTFLKRAFRWEARLGRYVAPLDLQTLLEVSYYTKNKGSANAITYTNVERTFYELALHGEETYTEWSVKLEREHNARSVTQIIRPPFMMALTKASGDEMRPCWEAREM